MFKIFSAKIHQARFSVPISHSYISVTDIDWKEEYYNKIRNIETTDPFTFYKKPTRLSALGSFPQLVKWSGRVVSVFIKVIT